MGFTFGDDRLPMRFWNRVNINLVSGCWEWNGSLSPGGYGIIGWKHRNSARAHRVSYQELVGPIKSGLVIDHLCRIKHCVNPAHLEAVTQSVNVRRGKAAESNRLRATRPCKRGHDFHASGDFYRQSGGKRRCGPCARAYWLGKYYERKSSGSK